MSDAFQTALDAVRSLVSDFAAHEARYLSPAYSEAEVRKDFIDKFFMALGWDVNHLSQKNPYEQEVKVELGVTDNASKRRADYAFFLEPNFRDPRFYVEAKKPSRDIQNADDYFQTVRYGWNSGTPLAVLTDFEQFRVLDCRYKPDIKTASSRGVAALSFHFRDYADEEKFARLYWIFSREAVAGDSLAKYAATLPKRKGKTLQHGLFKSGVQSIDEAFLGELDGWRETLAKAFKKSNPDLDGETLTEIVQRTLDRLVFLRFLEDKLIETHFRVADFGKSGSVWQDFVAASRKLDGIYNGIVFKQHRLLDRPGFEIDEGAFSDICNELAHDQSPYDFNLIPIHILGSIYERFLGKVIVATDKRARVEEKPEVRKAGGVYYTPEYIVRYIVDQTVGKLIDGKTPKEVAELRFADIACGSGSFLLGVFDCLLRYHTTWYNAHRDELPSQGISRGKRSGQRSEVPPVFAHDDGTLHLTLAKKSEILVNNIYGVDLDQQATEVAQLSLYLKLLEDETPGSARGHLEGFGGALLPTLSKNIVCGNSLIGSDILDGQLFEPAEERKLNPMNWEAAFPKVMSRGGFDVIVGNPPYRREKDFKHLLDQISQGQFGRTFKQARMDLWYYFVHRGLEILKPKGLLSFIVNSYWLASTGSKKLIKALKEDAHLDELFVLSALKVFAGVSGSHLILKVSNQSATHATEIKVVDSAAKGTAESFVDGRQPVAAYQQIHSKLFVAGKIQVIATADSIDQIFVKAQPLLSFGKVRQGIAENPAQVSRKSAEKYKLQWATGHGVFALTQQELLELRLDERESRLLRPYHDLKDLRRYQLMSPSLNLIYSTRATCPDLASYPVLHSHLSRFRQIMEARRETKARHNKWWHLHWPREEGLWEQAKLICLQMAERPSFIPVADACYVNFSVNVFVPAPDTRLNLSYFAGVLNSKLLWNWFRQNGKRRGIDVEINGNVLGRAPILGIDFSVKEQRLMHDEIVRKVEQLIETKARTSTANTDRDRDYLERRCAELDRQIDKLVYEHYGLTEDEIRIVEAG